MGKGIQGIPEKEGYRRGRGRREGKSKKKKWNEHSMPSSNTTTSRSTPHLDRHHTSIDTSSRPELGAGCNQSQQWRQPGHTIKRRLTNTHTALGACRHDRGAPPESQPATRTSSHKYNQTTTTCRLRRTNPPLQYPQF